MTGVLATGRHGLEFFRLFGPAHARLTGATFDFERDFARRYDATGELGLAALRADADRFASIGDGIDDIAVNLRNRGAGVFAAWEGGSADAARAQFTALRSAAEDLRDQFVHLGDSVAAVVDTADRASHDKAEGVAKLAGTRVGGLGRDEVDFLISLAERLPTDNVDDDELARAAGLVGEPFVRATPATVARIASAVGHWLTTTFVPDYEDRVARFNQVCAKAEAALSQAWQDLASALDAVRADHFDQIAAPAAKEAPPAPATSAPAAVTPARAARELPAGTPDTAAPADTTVTEAVPLSAGQYVGADVMRPAAFRGPTPTVTVPAAAAPQDNSQNFFGGLPFLGGAAGGGGGDQERQSLGLPVGPGAFDDVTTPEQVHVLGATDDTTQYTDEPLPTELAQDRAKSITELLDDDEDLW